MITKALDIARRIIGGGGDRPEASSWATFRRHLAGALRDLLADLPPGYAGELANLDLDGLMGELGDRLRREGLSFLYSLGPEGTAVAIAATAMKLHHVATQVENRRTRADALHRYATDLAHLALLELARQDAAQPWREDRPPMVYVAGSPFEQCADVASQLRAHAMLPVGFMPTTEESPWVARFRMAMMALCDAVVFVVGPEQGERAAWSELAYAYRLAVPVVRVDVDKEGVWHVWTPDNLAHIYPPLEPPVESASAQEGAEAVACYLAGVLLQ